ncbi:MAG: rhodanese-like domain-containing protein [Saprospiraceae bacterium]
MKNPTALIFLLFAGLFALPSCGTDTNAKTDSSPDGPPAGEPVGYENISSARFFDYPRNEDVVILDVRTPAETAEGILPGAIEIDYKAPDFAERIAKLPRDKTYLVYCRSGRRSGRACELMAEEGFENLYNLDGGYLGVLEEDKERE